MSHHPTPPTLTDEEVDRARIELADYLAGAGSPITTHLADQFRAFSIDEARATIDEVYRRGEADPVISASAAVAAAVPPAVVLDLATATDAGLAMLPAMRDWIRQAGAAITAWDEAHAAAHDELPELEAELRVWGATNTIAGRDRLEQILAYLENLLHDAWDPTGGAAGTPDIPPAVEARFDTLGAPVTAPR